jgi:tungstate transport system permease protein
MTTFSDSVSTALQLITSLDSDLLAIVGRSLSVSATACAIACALGLVLGAWLGVARFAGRGAVLTVLNTLLAVPSVVVGLVIYLLLSRSGPLGYLGWLFSFKAMVLAQTVLVLPVVTALTRQAGKRWKTRMASTANSCSRSGRGLWCAACCLPGTNGMPCSPW